MNDSYLIELPALETLCRQWSNALGRDISPNEALKLEREMAAWLAATGR